MDSENEPEMVRLATAGNSVLAHIWQQALEDEGIRCQVLGDYLEAGIGDISGMMTEVWVDKDDAERAEAILQRIHETGATEAANS